MFVKRARPNGARDGAEGAAPSRRVPAQERSKQRVERILEAAALVFAEGGYEAATMEAIAARAETSIGSIYQFFPNKLAVFNALARRYQEKVRSFFDVLASGPLLEKPWSEILEASIDAWVGFHENEPGFRAVWVGLHLTEQVVTEGEALNRELATRMESIFAMKLPRLPARMRPIVATMLVEVFSAMLVVSARRKSESERRAMMAETKTLLRRYLEPYEAPDRPPTKPRRRVKSDR